MTAVCFCWVYHCSWGCIIEGAEYLGAVVYLRGREALALQEVEARGEDTLLCI